MAMNRRQFTALVGGAVAASGLTPARAQAKGTTMFYSAVGPNLTLYEMNVTDATLTRRGTVSTRSNIQYVWPHPTKPILYAVSSNRTEQDIGNINVANAFRIDPVTGALTPHGEPAQLPSRPIHTSVDHSGEFILIAYNDPPSLTVFRLNPDGTLGSLVAQPHPLDMGKYPHQIRVTPDNKTVIMVTRGNNAPEDTKINPGSIKVFDFKDGVLTNRAAIQIGDGMNYGPRHLDFHPTQPWVYVSIESQCKLMMYRRDAATGLTRAPVFTKEPLIDPKAAGTRQHPGAIHIHPNGRFVYLTNRDSGTNDFNGKKVSAGGQNSVAVFSIDQTTGEPTLIQNADVQAFEPRTFAIDPTARMLVVGTIRSMAVRDGESIKTVSAGLSIFRVGADGKLEFVRKVDVDTAAGTQWWTGMVSLA